MKKIILVCVLLLGTGSPFAVWAHGGDGDGILALLSTVSYTAAYAPGFVTAVSGTATWTIGGITYTPGALGKSLMRAAGFLSNDQPSDDWWGKETGKALMDVGLGAMGFGADVGARQRWYMWRYHPCSLFRGGHHH